MCPITYQIIGLLSPTLPTVRKSESRVKSYDRFTRGAPIWEFYYKFHNYASSSRYRNSKAQILINIVTLDRASRILRGCIRDWEEPVSALNFIWFNKMHPWSFSPKSCIWAQAICALKPHSLNLVLDDTFKGGLVHFRMLG